MFRSVLKTALSALALVGLVAEFALLAPAQAAYVVTLQQVGANVVATGSGTIDLTGLSFFGNGALFAPEISPRIGLILTGPSVPGSTYEGYTGPPNFGSGGPTLPSSGSGDIVGINFFGTELEVPLGYVSDTALSTTSTYNNQTFASLGATPGTYVWTWGSGADADSFTVQIGVPEPSTWAMMLIGFAGLGFAFRRSRRKAAFA